MGFFLKTNEGFKIPVIDVYNNDINLIGPIGNYKSSQWNHSMAYPYSQELWDYMSTVGNRLNFSNGSYLESYIVQPKYIAVKIVASNGYVLFTNANFLYISTSSVYQPYYGFSFAYPLKTNTFTDFITSLQDLYNTGFTQDRIYNSGLIQYIQKSDNKLYPQSGSFPFKTGFYKFFDGLTEADATNEFGTGSSTGGGGGTYTLDSDPIGFPSLPSISATDTGFVTLFSPSSGEMKSLAQFMWSDLFDVATFKKLFTEPMECIIGCSIVPVTPPLGSPVNVKLGYVDTKIQMTKCASQYVTVECGSLDIARYFGSALDQSPYTKFSIYLPYIGTKRLSTDDIAGKTITVRYSVDVLSGSCVAMIMCGDSVLYSYSGSCAIGVPLTSSNWGSFITSAVQLAGAGVAVAATGGSAAGLLPATANSVLAMKPDINRTGTVSGSAGLLGVQTPYLIWECPNQSMAGNYQHFVGFPCNITYTLSNLGGYTEVESVQLDNISATEEEKNEIESLLKSGVIL